MIPHSKPLIGDKEYNAVKKVMISGEIAHGKEVFELEKELCAFTGHRYGLAVSSGTAAIYAALKALGISQDDTVVIPSYACTALANAVFLTGAEPILCDVEDDNAMMSVNTVKAVIKKNTGAVIVPHLFGYPAPAHTIERQLGIPVIEDCAQCIGAEIDGSMVGALTSISVFSFYATKVLCAGEGGFVACSDSDIARRLDKFREYDRCNHWEPNINIKLTDIQAAIIRVQLERLPSFIRRRRKLASIYLKALTNNKYISHFPVVTASVKPIYYRFIIRTSRRYKGAVIRYFNNRNISCVQPVFKPFHAYLKQTGFPVTQRLFGELLSIPLYPALTEKESIIIEKALRELCI